MFKNRAAVGEKLRELRKQRKLVGAEFAKLIGCTQSFVSKVERGEVRPSESYIDKACLALNLTRDERADLKALAKAFLFSYDRWSENDSSLGELQTAVNERILRSKRINLFSWALLSGFFQTAEYSRAIFAFHAGPHVSSRDIDSAVRIRQARRELIFDSDRRIVIVQNEAALGSWFIPKDMMRRQIIHFNELLKTSSAEIRILPLGRENRTVPVCDFEIYDDRLVVVGTPTFAFQFWEKDDISVYRSAFQAAVEDSVVGDAALAIGEKYLALLD